MKRGLLLRHSHHFAPIINSVSLPCPCMSRRVSRLAQVLPDTAALFKSRGLPLSLIAGSRPDILLYSPHKLMVWPVDERGRHIFCLVLTRYSSHYN